jgi:hypothetical protein
MDFKKLFSCLVLLALVVAAEAQPCDLTQKVMYLEGRMDTTFYAHDLESHLVTEILRPQPDGGHSREVYRVGGGRVNWMESGYFSFSYFHDDQNRVLGLMVFDDLNVSNFYYTLDYDAQGRLIKYTGYATPFLEDTVVTEITKYAYEGDKMVKMEEYTDSPDSNSLPSTTTTFEYDNHLNPEYNPLYGSNRPFKYMITKQTVSDSDGVYDPYSFTRECTYDKQGYPVKCVARYLDGSETVETYTYRCD